MSIRAIIKVQLQCATGVSLPLFPAENHDECNEQLTKLDGAVLLSVSHCRYKNPVTFGDHFPQLAGLVHYYHSLSVWNVQLFLYPLYSYTNSSTIIMKAALSLSTLATLALLTRTTFAAPTSSNAIVGFARDENEKGMAIPPRSPYLISSSDVYPSKVPVDIDTTENGEDELLEKRKGGGLDAAEFAVEAVVDIVNGILEGIQEDKDVRISLLFIHIAYRLMDDYCVGSW